MAGLARSCQEKRQQCVSVGAQYRRQSAANCGCLFRTGRSRKTPIDSVLHVLHVCTTLCTDPLSSVFFIFFRRDPRNSEKIVTRLANGRPLKPKRVPLANPQNSSSAKTLVRVSAKLEALLCLRRSCPLSECPPNGNWVRRYIASDAAGAPEGCSCPNFCSV